MSKHRDIDHIFKEGFEDYKAQSDTNLEKKMAAMIGISGIGGGSSSGGSSAGSGSATAESLSSSSGTVGSSGSGSSALTGSTVIGSAGKASLVTKTMGSVSAFVKSVGANIGLIAKSLGIIKTVATVAVVGGTTAFIINEVEKNNETEIIENKTKSSISNSQNHTLSIQKTLELKPSEWLKESGAQLSYLPTNTPSDYLAIEKEEKPEKLSIEQHYNLLASVDKFSSNQKPDYLFSPDEKEDIVFNKQRLENIEPRFDIIHFQQDNLNVDKDSLILNTEVPQPKSMSTLEKGFYLPNYNITAGGAVMPMLVWQLYKNDFQNDSLTSYQFKYEPQLSWQIGAEIRMQKKRSPWFYQLGINYQNIKLKSSYEFNEDYIDYAQSYWQIDTINYEIVINPPNIDTLLNIDSTYREYWISNSTHQTNIDQYHFIEIPIKIGYQYKEFDKNWSLEAALGISTSILINGKGYTYGPHVDFIGFETKDISPKLHFFAIGHIGFNYHINQTTLFIRPSVKYQLTQTQYSLSSEKNRFIIFGTQLGVRFKLFKNAGQP